MRLETWHREFQQVARERSGCGCRPVRGRGRGRGQACGCGCGRGRGRGHGCGCGRRQSEGERDNETRVFVPHLRLLYSSLSVLCVYRVCVQLYNILNDTMWDCSHCQPIHQYPSYPAHSSRCRSPNRCSWVVMHLCSRHSLCSCSAWLFLGISIVNWTGH
jgi:hypothetical protein